jgi:hypothetical protein
MRRLAALLTAGALLTGCASRDVYQHNALTPLINLYNRNFIVAAPTYAANYLCGFPFFWVSAGVAAISQKSDSSDEYYAFVNGIYVFPAMACGAIVGLPFVPLSFICPENPWYDNTQTYYREWSCAPPVSGPFTRQPGTSVDLKNEKHS